MAWFPAETQVTPRASSSGERSSMTQSAPRGLKLPVRWKSSSLRMTSVLPSRRSTRGEESRRTGVVSTRSPSRVRAARTSSRVGASAMAPTLLQRSGRDGLCHAGCRRRTVPRYPQPRDEALQRLRPLSQPLHRPLPALADALAVEEEVAAGLLRQPEGDRQVQRLSGPADALAVEDVELGLVERRGDLCLLYTSDAAD